MADLSTFNFVVIASDREGYYYDRWDRAVPVAVVATTKAEAQQKVWDIQGAPPRGRFWKARLKSVEPYFRGAAGGDSDG